VGTSSHDFVAGGLGRHARTRVHGQIRGQEGHFGPTPDCGEVLRAPAQHASLAKGIWVIVHKFYPDPQRNCGPTTPMTSLHRFLSGPWRSPLPRFAKQRNTMPCGVPKLITIVVTCCFGVGL
jgi:hypothetical protein